MIAIQEIMTVGLQIFHCYCVVLMATNSQNPTLHRLEFGWAIYCRSKFKVLVGSFNSPACVSNTSAPACSCVMPCVALMPAHRQPCTSASLREGCGTGWVWTDLTCLFCRSQSQNSPFLPSVSMHGSWDKKTTKRLLSLSPLMTVEKKRSRPNSILAWLQPNLMCNDERRRWGLSPAWVKQANSKDLPRLVRV